MTPALAAFLRIQRTAAVPSLMASRAAVVHPEAVPVKRTLYAPSAPGRIGDQASPSSNNGDGSSWW
jgi:hypothetical protein